MDNDNAVTLLLSREELLFALNLLEAQFIPGLDPDPLGELTPAQRSLALTVAGRALRARELAQIQSNGDWLLHNDLLATVGGCAYAQSVISVYHWAAMAETPARYFGHIRDSLMIAHMRPEDVLHRFTLLPSREQLLAQILAFCEYEAGVDSPALELTLPAAVFGPVRELAAAGDLSKAVELMGAHAATPETAKLFAETLAGSPRISILQTLKQQGDGTVQKRDVTLLQNNNRAWLIIAAPDEGGPLQVKSTAGDELQRLLAEWI